MVGAGWRRAGRGSAGDWLSMLGALALLGGVALANGGCEDLEDLPAGTEREPSAASADGFTRTVENELGWRKRRPRPLTPPGGGTGGTLGTGGFASATPGTGGSIGAGPVGSGGAPTTPTGGGGGSSSGTVDATTTGGRCPGNQPMPEGGPCGPYGISCTYDTATSSHICICLNASVTGKQGWGCR